MSTIDDKAAMRAAMLARRDLMTAPERAADAARLAASAVVRLAPMIPPPGAISAFLAIGSEPDTAPLVAALALAGYVTALPVMAGKAAPLVFRTWRPGEALHVRAWGIREPLPAAPVAEPELLLVPLLAFDRTGNRLGYGGGYYDRTLSALRRRRPVIAVGVAFDAQEVDAVPRSDYDEPLDWVMTPSVMVRCTP